MTTNAQRARGIQNVRANTDPVALVGQINAAFKEHRENTDERIRSLESGIADFATRQAGLTLSGSGGDKQKGNAALERQAFASYARTGDEGGFADVRAQMSVGSDPDGGYTVSPAVGDTIQRKLFDVSPIARLARVVTINEGDAYEEPYDPSDIGAEWVGETQSRPELDSSKLKMLKVPVHEIYTHQVITQKLLDDSSQNLGQYIELKISEKFARAEGSAMMTGDGILKPRGLLTYPTSTAKDADRPWWTIQHVNTGTSGGFGTSPAGGDAIFDLVYSLRAPYRPNARFLMNLTTAGVVRKLKDGDGRYLWADAREGQPATLAGFPVELDEEMPDIGANSLSIAFGDFGQAYLMVQKPGLRMLRDPYTNKPNVVLYAYRRAGGALANSEAVKLLRFGTA